MNPLAAPANTSVGKCINKYILLIAISKATIIAKIPHFLFLRIMADATANDALVWPEGNDES